MDFPTDYSTENYSEKLINWLITHESWFKHDEWKMQLVCQKKGGNKYEVMYLNVCPWRFIGYVTEFDKISEYNENVIRFIQFKMSVDEFYEYVKYFYSECDFSNKNHPEVVFPKMTNRYELKEENQYYSKNHLRVVSNYGFNC